MHHMKSSNSVWNIWHCSI